MSTSMPYVHYHTYVKPRSDGAATVNTGAMPRSCTARGSNVSIAMDCFPVNELHPVTRYPVWPQLSPQMRLDSKPVMYSDISLGPDLPGKVWIRWRPRHLFIVCDVLTDIENITDTQWQLIT